jgi:zinc D-Ala-D-Ala carboxypeptidase
MSSKDLHLKYFKISEFDCNCRSLSCSKNKMNPNFLIKMDSARIQAKTPFRITSGFRCQSKQKELYMKGISSKKRSSHEKGIAADILVRGSATRSRIIRGLILAGFTRMGMGKNWVHVDDDRDKTMNRVWVYKW